MAEITVVPAQVPVEEPKPRVLLKVLGAVRLFGERRMGHRTIKVIYPRCLECQSQDSSPGWWHRCEKRGHDPYFTKAERKELTPNLGEADQYGRQEVLGPPKEKVFFERVPNMRAVAVTGRHNGDPYTAIRHARGFGARMPEEMDVAPFCQFSTTEGSCWAQDGDGVTLKSYGELGAYCDINQAKAVAADQRNIRLEVLNDDKKRDQWSKIAV